MVLVINVAEPLLPEMRPGAESCLVFVCSTLGLRHTLIDLHANAPGGAGKGLKMKSGWLDIVNVMLLALPRQHALLCTVIGECCV